MWGSENLLNMAAEIEGHPDNVVLVLYGVIQLENHTGERCTMETVYLPYGLQCVCVIPDVIGKKSQHKASSVGPFSILVVSHG